MASLDIPVKGRGRVLWVLKMNGPQTAPQLAKELELTTMAVRQHLAALQGEGAVAFSTADREAGKVGRSARLWRLTEAGCKRFPDAHAGLAVELLQAFEDVFGNEGLDRLTAERTREQIRRYRARMPGRRVSLKQRVAALTKILCEDRFLAEWKGKADGTLELCENHCSIQRAARSCPSLCEGELHLFRSVLGDDVSVQRVEHLLKGDRRCVYQIAPSITLQLGKPGQRTRG